MGYNSLMKVSEGLREFHHKLFPGEQINEGAVTRVEEQMWSIFYQQAISAAELLGHFMLIVPADVLRTRNGTDTIAGDPTEAQEMLVRAIGGVQACELVAQQHEAELEIFTPEVMAQLLRISGLEDLQTSTDLSDY
jgi:hypothetical protein